MYTIKYKSKGLSNIMSITYKKLKQYNSKYRIVVFVNNEPICIVDSDTRLAEITKYLYGYPADINDGKIKRILDEIMNGCG